MSKPAISHGTVGPNHVITMVLDDAQVLALVAIIAAGADVVDLGPKHDEQWRKTAAELVTAFKELVPQLKKDIPTKHTPAYADRDRN